MTNFIHQRKRELILALLIAVLIGLIGVRAPIFLTLKSMDNLVTDMSILLMLALAQMLVIVTRGIDLSIASTLALTGMMVALLNHHHPDIPVLVLLGISIVLGAALGLINGVLIGVFRLPPIVVTLGTMSVYRGLTFVFSGGAWVSSNDLSKSFIEFPLSRFGGVTALVWLALLSLIVAAWVVKYTRFGRELFAIGNHPSAARLVGIRIPARLIGVYTLSGMMAGLCGYLWVARYAVAFTEIAYGFELNVIAACVIGGVSIAGGAGTVVGVVLGALFLGVINNALPIIQVSPFWQSAITGTVILVAVLVNARGDKRGGKQILPLHFRSASAKG